MNATLNTTLTTTAMSHVRGGLVLPGAVLLSESNTYAQGISHNQEKSQDKWFPPQSLQRYAHLT